MYRKLDSNCYNANSLVTLTAYVCASRTVTLSYQTRHERKSLKGAMACPSSSAGEGHYVPGHVAFLCVMSPSIGANPFCCSMINRFEKVRLALCHPRFILTLLFRTEAWKCVLQRVNHLHHLLVLQRYKMAYYCGEAP